MKQNLQNGKYADNFVPLRIDAEIQGKYVDSDLNRGLFRTEQIMSNALSSGKGSEKEVSTRIFRCQELREHITKGRTSLAIPYIHRYGIESGILFGGNYPPLVGLWLNYLLVRDRLHAKQTWHALAHRMYTKWSQEDRLSGILLELSRKIEAITQNAPRIHNRPVVLRKQLEELGIEFPLEISLDIVAIRVGGQEYEVR